MRQICVCGLPWAAHEVISDATSSLPQSAASAPLPPRPVGAFNPAPHRPVVAFTGLGRPAGAMTPPRGSTTAALVQQQRRSSIQRNLHPNEPTSPVATTNRRKARSSGPPRPYSEPVPTLSLLDDFASSSAAQAPSSVQITVGILPKVLDTSDYNDMLDLSVRYTLKSGRDIETVQHRLNLSNLVFTINVPTTGPIFDYIDTAFKNHCLVHKIDYASAPASVASTDDGTPNAKAWMLTGPKGRSGSRTWVEDPKLLTRFSFTLQALQQLPFSYTPNNLGEGPFIFIVPRFRNLYAPIASLFEPIHRLPDHVLAHRCFGNRVLHPVLTSLADDPPPSCGLSCTPSTDSRSGGIQRNLSDAYIVLEDSEDDDEAQFPEPQALIDELVRDGLPPISTAPSAPIDTGGRPTELSSSTIVTRSVRRQQWQEEAAAAVIPISITAPFIPGPLLTAAMERASTSIKPRSFLGAQAPLDLTLQNMPGAGSYSFAAWQDHLLLPREIAMDDHVIIAASSIDEGARTLIILCFWLFAGRPTGLKLKEVLQEQFPSPRPTIEGPTGNGPALFALRVQIGPGIGRSPRNEVVAEAIKIIMADGHYWTECVGYQTLRLHPSCTPFPLRSCAPFPASPFLFSTLFDGRKTASKFDITFLSRLIPADSLSIVKKIESVALERPLYASQSEHCTEYQYLLNIPGVDPTMISLRRSREEHDGVCTSVVSYLTLGTVDIEHKPDFLALADGFNMVVEASADQDRPHHILEWFETPCRELVLVAYDRHIKTPADIISHLEFTETNPEHNLWNENEEIVALITTFITHYLTEAGHPADPDRVLHALIADGGDSTDPLLRSNLFLSVLTGSTLLPIRPTWKIKCYITHDWSQEYPCTDADGNEDYGPEIVISFRSCFKTLAITNNARLRQLLGSEDPQAGRDTDFSRWIHGQLLSSRHSFTSS
ncbi:hypothetical protein DFH07DRAFT_986936 [Mycena maculata]|uniref:Uncharacterized protein n=1 Tax=Mycena maculata TaxID=230809 RepID=A0AAD7MYD8_9AGAR|nr:hypothetical protein DFH07DRAFT_986936 [Mycena maculata]